MGSDEYNVYKDGDSWGASARTSWCATVRKDTQQGACDALRDLLAAGSGGEISVHGTDGQIRHKNTIDPKHDPRSSRR